MLRDHYEGTAYDMTQGPASGPYGDPSRFDPGDTLDIYPGDGVSQYDATSAGAFERATSIFRCSYSFVAQPRADPAADPAMAWVAQYAPHAASYTPVFPAAPDVPNALSTGSLHEVDTTSQYWAHAVVGNWAARFYLVAHPIVAAERDAVEAAAVADVARSSTLRGLNASALGAVAERAAQRDVDRWWALFWRLAAQVKDGQRLDDLHAEKLAPTHLFYRKSWLERAGFFFSDNSGLWWMTRYMRLDSSSNRGFSWRIFRADALRADWHAFRDAWRDDVSPPLQLALAFVAGILCSACFSSCCCGGSARRRGHH